MARVKSWWRLKRVRHRDAVVLSVLSAALLLAGQLPLQRGLYEEYLLPVVHEPFLLIFDVILLLLAYTSYYGGILVLLGGVNFLWGQASRGRFLLSLGLGIGSIGLLKQVSLAVLTSGSPIMAIVYFATSLTGLGLTVGCASYVLMHEYALMLKKHARSKWRQWRRTRRPQPDRRKARRSTPNRG